MLRGANNERQAGAEVIVQPRSPHFSLPMEYGWNLLRRYREAATMVSTRFAGRALCLLGMVTDTSGGYRSPRR